MDIEIVIKDSFSEVLSMTGSTQTTELNRDAILLESGLDSLGFAILVTKLEEKLGYDPFVIMEEAVYPRTFGEFIDIYEKYKQ